MAKTAKSEKLSSARLDNAEERLPRYLMQALQMFALLSLSRPYAIDQRNRDGSTSSTQALFVLYTYNRHV